MNAWGSLFPLNRIFLPHKVPFSRASIKFYVVFVRFTLEFIEVGRFVRLKFSRWSKTHSRIFSSWPHA